MIIERGPCKGICCRSSSANTILLFWSATDYESFCFFAEVVQKIENNLPARPPVGLDRTVHRLLYHLWCHPTLRPTLTMDSSANCERLAPNNRVSMRETRVTDGLIGIASLG